MTRSKDWKLVPFPGLEHPEIEVSTEIELRYPLLQITYRIQGPDLSSILLPEIDSRSGSTPLRKDLLWQHTCLEAFLSLPNLNSYWEINLAPPGHWNVYHFAGYRSEQKTESRIQKVKFIRPKGSYKDCYEGTVECDFSPIDELEKLRTESLLLGVTSVIETLDGKKSYWALTHRGQKPDFHIRESFKELKWSR
jgi:hypothetical protein